MFLFRKAVNVAIALADNLSSSFLSRGRLGDFPKGRASSSLEETALGDSVSNALKATGILLGIFSYFHGGSCVGLRVGTSL